MGKYQYLNLEQKMAKIRKKMPSLLKRFHNDDADYDFATLDDIYASMTPALNKYGVNFDIVKETPTQHDSEGKSVYLILDKDGFWRYESDLELCWTNIDNPKEERHVVIHLIGTHEIPDKAHGTAMTYGLKYYFRNKFCMQQLDGVNDDPDGMEYGTEKQETESPGTESSGKDSSGDKKNLKAAKSYVDQQLRKTEQAGDAMPGKEITEAKGTQSGHKNREVLKADSHSVKEEAENLEGNTKKNAKQDKNTVRTKEAGEIGQQSLEEPKPTETKSGQNESESQKKEALNQSADIGDGFQTVPKEEVPFEDGSFMDQLEEALEEETGNGDSSLEAAKKYICNFGVYEGKSLGEIMNSGLKGCETIKWIANRYKGPDAEIVKAANLLLENQDLVMEQQAA